MHNLRRPRFGTLRRGGTFALIRSRWVATWRQLPMALFCIGVGFALPACTTATFIVQQYDGAPLPGSKIAILRILGGGDSFIAALDGEQLGFKLDDPRDRIHVEMLPGRHLISLGRVDDDRVVTRAFEARPSVTYRAVVLPSRLVRDAYGRPTWTVGVFEIDPSTDELGKDISQGPELPPPSAPSTPPSAGSAPSAPAPNTPVSSVPAPSAPVPSASASDGSIAPEVAPPPSPPAPSTSGSGSPAPVLSPPPPASVSSSPSAPAVSPVSPAASASPPPPSAPAVNPPPSAPKAGAQP